MNTYTIALQTGGLMEDPQICYSDYQDIQANSREEALAIYNKKNKCGYFYGTVMAERVDGEVRPVNDAISIGRLKKPY